MSGIKGFKHSDETRAKLRASFTPERRAAISEMAKKRTEHLALMNQRKITPESRAKISASHKGQKHPNRKYSEAGLASIRSAVARRSAKKHQEHVQCFIFNVESKQCTICYSILPITRFYNNKRMLDKHSPWCKPCTKTIAKNWADRNRDKTKSYEEKRQASDYEVIRHAKQRAKKMGGTLDEYLDAREKGICEICGALQSESVRTFHVDHCHTHKYIRGLLCYHCNNGLGLFKDDPVNLIAAIEYLDRYALTSELVVETPSLDQRNHEPH